MQYKIIPPPLMGINRQDNPAFLGLTYCYDLYNMQIHNTFIQKRSGYSVLGTGIDSTLTGLDIYEFSDGTGVKHLLGFTNKHVYEFNNSSQAWERINASIALRDSDGSPSPVWVQGTEVTFTDGSGFDQFVLAFNKTFAANAVLATHTPSSAFNITHANTISFYIESDVAIAANKLRVTIYDNTGGTPKKMQCVIGALSAGVSTLCTYSIPSLMESGFVKTALTTIKLEANAEILTTAAGLNSAVTLKITDTITAELYLDIDAERIAKDVCLDQANPPDWTSGTGLVISDTLNNVVHYDGADGLKYLITTDITDFDYVKELLFDNGHLCFYNFKDASYRLKNIIWTTGYDCDSTGAWTTGTSGEALLPMVRGSIRRVLPMNKNKIIYADRSIAFQSYVGGVDIFTFDSITNDLGILGNKSILEFVTSNIFMGDNLNIYELNASHQLSILSNLINELIIDEIDLAYKDKIFFWNDKTNKRVYLFYVGKSDGGSTRSYFAINMLYNNISWERGRLADGICAFADYTSDVDYKCNDAIFSGLGCDDATYGLWRCDDARILGQGTKPIFMKETAGACVLDSEVNDDNGSIIDCFYETGDITIQDASQLTYYRASKISFNACKNKFPDVDSSLTVEYSIDGGTTWTECVDSPVSLNNDWTTHTLDVTDEQTRQMRFKLSNNDSGDVQISELTLHYNPISVMD
jgi:hypothetical protein